MESQVCTIPCLCNQHDFQLATLSTVDTPEVQHEKAAHFAAVHRALAGVHSAPSHYAPQNDYNNHYQAPAHYNKWSYEPAPAPVHGVPVDTAEVAQLKAKHLATLAEANAKAGHYSSYAPAAHYHQAPAAYHYPTIVNGVPEETYEVKAAKAKHLAAVHEAQSRSSYGPYDSHNEDDGSYKTQSYDAGHYDDGSYKAQSYDGQYYH